MRRWIGFVWLIVGSAGCGYEAPSGQARQTTVSLHVEGMMCAESCAHTVQKILAELPGVEGASVDYVAKQATCQVDASKFDVEAAIAELADQDFVATVRE